MNDKITIKGWIVLILTLIAACFVMESIWIM